MISRVLSLSGFNRAVCLATGGAGGYAFTNPDVDNVYDIFPLHKPPPFAFINVYRVPKDECTDFENNWKELVRFSQRQEGYLFTKMLKADSRPSCLDGKPQFDYIDIQQWTTGDAQRRVALRPGFQELYKEIASKSVKDPMMYSVVVDDTPSQV
uniref:Uncharacterized protein n=1 Tax=Spumella elongata TaxID=89044 RepID=A0A7S3LYJ8_9STRA|mmetsp:Transcript_159368/g.511292  ORF Transcript_159368/g.511292 Transcript_159368/m.511292 type:complete len:154 (+) Transcript_159368:46-507(+)|eukprot:CAMPEP_0177182876 /NCGR_PEP_ID=MMETSP0367-20130122/16703_1 /TAXON_ID=447022 ORGANISM="Scrippsiella hangoei-like, Strain SHHI-4" /NCGR_SAMPLE_ID=MMETSP0367 /ASSEMBLY_ACC=CAM_ASM_000362 /LENGTH=153 /DNA_ID=CAMNT_0018629845 /DNA_START=38 /DNA_END=499 /DNA_ORIENTATION=-